MALDQNPHVSNWDQIFRPGAQPAALRQRFEKAGRSTTALLVCDGRPVPNGVFDSDRSGHAEMKLLRSAAWQSTLAAMRRAAGPSEVFILVNRTPCHAGGCSRKLADALRDVLKSSPEIDRARMSFALACTGIYETAGPLENRDDQGPTTSFDLKSLATAGWRLFALQVGATLTDRGMILAQYLRHVTATTRIAAP